MTRDTKLVIAAVVAVAAMFAGLLAVIAMQKQGENAAVVLRPAGCIGLAAAGVNTKPLDGGLCQVSGRYYAGSHRAALVVDGVTVEIAAAEIVAAKPM